MSLENYTGNIADLVVTNPTPEDHKSQGDDHLRGIKKTLKQTFPNFDGPTTQNPGQITPDTVQIGDSATAAENHFWDGSVANQLSLKRGTPDAPGTELIKALNGVLSFPNQGQSLTTQDGYVKLPGGLIVLWKYLNIGLPANVRVQYDFTWYPAFPNSCFGAVISPINGLNDTGTQAQMNVFGFTPSGATVSGFCSYDINLDGFVIAVGY